MATAINLELFGPYNYVMQLNQYNWSKLFYPVMGDGVMAGIGDEAKVYGNSTGMQVKIKTGDVRVAGMMGRILEETAIAISAADTTYPRWDRIVMRSTFLEDYKSTMQIAVLEGTPAASPELPALTKTEGAVWETLLADIYISAGIVTLAADVVYDKRKIIQSMADVNSQYWRGKITD